VIKVTLKLRYLPEVQRYGSLVFADFEPGVSCLRELAASRAAPASIRLMDNDQFQFGHALKPPLEGWLASLVDGIKKAYVLRIKGFLPDKLCVATLLFEGSAKQVEAQASQMRTTGWLYFQ
jgi:alkyldihydroxyacetonephosphate synthase